jgi:long-subunit fatty acid transport protein
MLAAGLALGLATVAAGTAQAPITVGRFDFNFSNPGARSLGFGGAFVALADDATAAFANPAGLVQLTRLEVAAEGRYWDRSTRFLAGGRIDGEPTGIGRDTVRGLTYGRSATSEAGPSFASVVVPRGRWAFALYGHRAASFELTAESQRLFSADDETEPGTFGFDASRESVDLGLTTVGLVAAYRPTEWASLGLALVGSSTSLRTTSEFFLPDGGWEGGIYDENHFLPQNLLSRSFVDVDDTALSLSLGAHFHLTEQVAAGLVFRQGARFRGSSGVESGPAAGEPPFGGTTVAHFSLPDVWSFGLSWRSRDGTWTFAGELDRVGYRGLLELDSNDAVEAFSPPYADGREYHAGGEYAFLDLAPAVVAVRLGAWLETAQDGTLTQNRTHWSAGVGVAARRVQVDLGIDLSEELDTASVSLVYSF